MPGTYSQLLFHIVFSTRGRQPWIAPDIASRVHSYLGGVIRHEGGVLLDSGGFDDHVHLYVRGRPDGPISGLLRITKSRSSKWVHATFPGLADFAWQEGYAAFTVSKSQELVLRRYIAGQADHHRREDFKSELLRLLAAHGVEYDARFVFD